jgi:hypothetical protein
MATLIEAAQRPARTRNALEVARAQALFASALQASDQPCPERVHEAVTTTLRRLGNGGCAALLAAEFGDHPELAAARMGWALAVTRMVYPAGPLALAT